jgi:hypothetical protein
MLLTIPPAAMIALGAAFIVVGLAGDHLPIDLVALLGWLAIGAGLLWQVRRRREALIAKVRAEGAAGPMPLEPPGPKSPAAPVA